MTRLQQVLWELTMDYLGHPYYVTGNAIVKALDQQLDGETAHAIHASHGMFVPGQFGVFPEEHSKTGSKPYMGSSLADVDAYEDLFLFRDPAQPWLLDSRPRDVFNTHDIRTQHGQPALAHEMIMGRPEDGHWDTQTTTWYVQAYIHADDPSILPLADAALDGLQFGGQRNYGYGMTHLKDSQMVDLDALDYGRLATADAHRLELVTPFVLESAYPGADDYDIPWWWGVDDAERLRVRTEQVIEDREAFPLRTVDHGQIVEYAGDRPIETARNGLRRIGSHAKYGFGEFRVRPVSEGEEDRSDL